MRAIGLDAEVIRPMDGVHEWLLQVLIFADRGAVVVVHGLDAHRHAQAAGGGHLLHQRAVAKLVHRDHGDEPPPLPAEQRQQIHRVSAIGQKVVVRELQKGPRVKRRQLVNLLFQHVQRLGAIRSHVA